MAIEHEFKFILKNAEELREKLSEDELPPDIEDIEYGYLDEIEQFYISDNARFRHVSGETEPYDYVFTYKQMIDGKLLEIETHVEKEDFDLAKKARITGLRKDRHVVYDNSKDSLRWEIDFLLNDDGSVYFALAEVETKPKVRRMDPPAFLLPYVELIVPQHHNHYFTNHRLTNREYAARALELYREDLATLG